MKDLIDYLRNVDALRAKGSVCQSYFLNTRQPAFLCQVVVPIDLTDLEARRLCAFIETLAVDFSPAPSPPQEEKS